MKECEIPHKWIFDAADPSPPSPGFCLALDDVINLLERSLGKRENVIKVFHSSIACLDRVVVSSLQSSLLQVNIKWQMTRVRSVLASTQEMFRFFCILCLRSHHRLESTSSILL